MATPLYFGRAEAPLFGLYHPPQTRRRGAARRAALIIPPFGEEAIRAHRPMRLLAERLSESGIPTMRFDPFATGDSAGADDEARLGQWRDDVIWAAEELCDLSEGEALTLIGLRTGAMLALGAVAELPPPIAAREILLWDPVLDGAGYLKSLGLDAEGGEALGFPVSAGLAEDWAGFDAAALWPPASGIFTVGDDAMVPEALVEQTTPVRLDREDPPWNGDNALNAFAVPMGAIDAMVGTLSVERLAR